MTSNIWTTLCVTKYFEGYEVLLNFPKLKGRQKGHQHWQMAFLLLHKHWELGETDIIHSPAFITGLSLLPMKGGKNLQICKLKLWYK